MSVQQCLIKGKTVLSLPFFNIKKLFEQLRSSFGIGHVKQAKTHTAVPLKILREVLKSYEIAYVCRLGAETHNCDIYK